MHQIKGRGLGSVSHVVIPAFAKRAIGLRRDLVRMLGLDPGLRRGDDNLGLFSYRHTRHSGAGRNPASLLNQIPTFARMTMLLKLR